MTSLLNGKVDDSQVLTDVPANAVFTDTVYSKPANEPISYITGLQTALGTVKVAGQVNKAEQIAQNNLEVQRNMQTLTDAIKTGVNSTADSLKGTVNTDVNGLEEAVTSGVSNATVTAHMETNVLEDLQKEANAISDEGFSSVVSALEDIKGEMSNSGNALT